MSLQWWTLFNNLPEADERVWMPGNGCVEYADFSNGCTVYQDGVYTVNTGCDGCDCTSYYEYKDGSVTEWLCVNYRTHLEACPT